MSASPAPRVADFTFQLPDGTPLRLSALGAKALVLVFLRHLG
jgi:hypothetical protein